MYELSLLSSHTPVTYSYAKPYVLIRSLKRELKQYMRGEQELSGMEIDVLEAQIRIIIDLCDILMHSR